MTELIVFPDTGAILIDYLVEVLDVPVVSKIPADRPGAFVRVRRTGGPLRNIVTDEPTITVDCWADDEGDAHDLAQLVRAHLHALPGQMLDDVPVYRVTEFAGPADLPDPLSDQPRFTQTFAVAVRGAVTGS